MRMKRLVEMVAACALTVVTIPAHAVWVVVYAAGGIDNSGGRASGLDSFPTWSNRQGGGTATLDGAPVVFPGLGPSDIVRMGDLGEDMATIGESFASVVDTVPVQRVTYFAGQVTMTGPNTSVMSRVDVVGNRAAMIDITVSMGGNRAWNWETMAGMAFPSPPSSTVYRKLDIEAYQECIGTCNLIQQLGNNQCNINEARQVAGGAQASITSALTAGAGAAAASTLVTAGNLVVGAAVGGGIALGTYNAVQSSFSTIISAAKTICVAAVSAANTKCLTKCKA